jgi:acetoin utilization deacetylase AcuC-like enzyme
LQPFGADTFQNDPETVAKINLQIKDYYLIGKKIGSTGKKCLITQEGGYDMDSIGNIVTSFLEGLIDSDK